MQDDIIGKRFGKLIVIEFSHFYIKPSDGKKEKRWLCQCDCGGTAITAKRKLQIGWSKSCGCMLLSRGGLSNHPDYHLTYSVWNMVVQRATNKKFDKDLKYVGRGISVTDSWLGKDGFTNFINDIGVRPSAKHTIERVDVNGNYCKENCVWTDDNSLQAFNQRVKINNSSGKTGVGFDKSKNNWYASIRKGADCRKKSFNSFEEAAEQRDLWELELYGFLKHNNG